MKKFTKQLQDIAQGQSWIESVLNKAKDYCESKEELISIDNYLKGIANFNDRMTLQDMVVRLDSK